MTTKPRYGKFHDFANACISYTIHHPDLNGRWAEVRREGSGWVAENIDGEHRGATRTAATEALLEACRRESRRVELRDAFYAKEDEMTTGSTAWHALLSGRENADDTVVEGNVEDDSLAYWELAWSGYGSLMDEIPSCDLELAKLHNLEDLEFCEVHFGHAVQIFERYYDEWECEVRACESCVDNYHLGYLEPVEA